MVSRGGGVTSIDLRKIPRRHASKDSQTSKSSSKFWLVVHLLIDVCDAMGANCASNVAEKVAPYLAQLTGARIGLRIVSNLASSRLTKVKIICRFSMYVSSFELLINS